MLKIKICGITNMADALAAVEAGADLLGFIFFQSSPRTLTLEKAQNIIEILPDTVEKVGVFVNENVNTVNKIAQKLDLDYVQLHGEESPDYVKRIENVGIIKTIRVRDKSSLTAIGNYPDIDIVLLDTYKEDEYGGTGRSFDWALAAAAKEYKIPIMLSGGLTVENVAAAIKIAKPYGVDVASGVESSAGLKDPQKIKKFIQAAKVSL